MRPARFSAPAVSALALSLILVACGQTSADPGDVDQPVATPLPTATPTTAPTPKPTPKPTPAPAGPITSPSLAPVEPTPPPIQLIEHPVPMIGRSIADGVNVRTRPSLNAPLLSGERYPGEEREDTEVVPNIRLRDGERVWVSMGPVYADGESWYEVGVYDGGQLYWGYGWVAGRFLVHDADIVGWDPVLANIHGTGSGASVEVELRQYAGPTVRYMATPMPDAARCTIAVSFVRTDGTTVEVDSRTMDEATFFEVHAWDLEGLNQDRDGTATLDVVTDCSFAATLFIPQG